MSNNDKSGAEGRKRDEESEDVHDAIHPLDAVEPHGLDPDEDPELNEVLFTAANGISISVVNRALLGSGRNEGVANCTVEIGPESATTNQSGNVFVDLSDIPDGEHALRVTPPADQLENGPVGPGLPSDTSKDRIWTKFMGSVSIVGGRVVGADPSEWIAHSNPKKLRVAIKPKWMRCQYFGNRTRGIDTIIVHHTAGTNTGRDVRWFVYGGDVSIHYLIAPNGDTFKFVDESERAWHSGYPGEECYWLGEFDLNQNSIGIEMVHDTGAEYNVAQVDALVELVERLLAAYGNIPKVRVIGHSDVGLREVEKTPPTWLGRKSTDPGSAFPWERLEAKGIGLIAKPGHVSSTIYGGYFHRVPSGRLGVGDNDGQHRYGGRIIPEVSGAVEELQRDLDAIGYYCKPFDGKFGNTTKWALQMFEQHMYSGSRRRGPNQWNSGDGKLDRRDADLIKRVKGDVS